MHVWGGSFCALVITYLVGCTTSQRGVIVAHDIWDSTVPCLDTDEDCPDDGHAFKDESSPASEEDNNWHYEPYPPYPEPALDPDYEVTVLFGGKRRVS